MHIIGGHKRNERICELLSRILLNKYQEYYYRIIKLFPEENKRFGKCETTYLARNPLNIIHEDLALYKEFLDESFLEWSHIPQSDLLDIEEKSYNYFSFFKYNKRKQATVKLRRNPFLPIFEIPELWGSEIRGFMKNRISKDFTCNKFDIACIPNLLHEGYKEILIHDIHYNILILLNQQMIFGRLLNEIKKVFQKKLQTINEEYINLYYFLSNISSITNLSGLSKEI